jgi:phage portal protein BeeE
MLGGRGAGKTRTGAEWVRAMVHGVAPWTGRPHGRIALVGETMHDAREVMVAGECGLLEAKHTAAREIALAFGVPPMLLGIPGDNTFANYAEASWVFFRQTVLPLAQRVGSSIAQWPSPQFGESIRVTIETDRIDALAARPRRVVGPRLRRGVPDAEQKREAVGYGPVAGGDRRW